MAPTLLKPENVMLVPGSSGAPPKVKLLDFGVAKIRADSGGGTAAVAASKDVLATSVGALMGTAKAFTTVRVQTPTLSGKVARAQRTTAR